MRLLQRCVTFFKRPIGMFCQIRSVSSGPIAVAMSGGVDSSVAAYLLKKEGHEIFGIHMQNWDEEEEKGVHDQPGVCSSAQDLLDVKLTCQHLGIPLREVHIASYIAGLTPNPDVMCNREIKFKALLDHAIACGATALATGHYARVAPPTEPGAPARLLQAADSDKDQTYFLSSVPGMALARALFPLGGLTKARVREIAAAAELPTARKRESMGLCFVGKRRFKPFISGYIPPRPGRFVSVEGQDLGSHEGLHLYTVGQGARISGAPAKWFVVSKDAGSNTVTVALGTDHPALFSASLHAGPAHWIAGSPPLELQACGGGVLRCTARLRHQQPLAACTVSLEATPPPAQARPGDHEEKGAFMRVDFDHAQRSIAPGQVVAWYRDGECLGSAPILRAGPSLWDSMAAARRAEVAARTAAAAAPAGG